MGDIALRGNRLTFAKGGRAGYALGSVAKVAKIAAKRLRKPKPHRDKPPSKIHKDVPTMAAEGGRIGLTHGKTPEHYLVHGYGSSYKPKHRPKKALGKLVSGAVKKIKKHIDTKKGKFPEIESLTHQVGPYVGDVGSEGKRRRAGPRAGRGKSPGRRAGDRPRVGGPKASRSKKTWPPKYSDLLQRYPKMPQPHKAPGDIPYIPMPKHDPKKPKKYQPAAEGGRIGKAHGGSFEAFGGGVKGKPHSSKEGREAAGKRTIKRFLKKGDLPVRRFPTRKWKAYDREGVQEGGRIGLKEGGNGKWMQKVSASIKRRGTKGKCTPITKPGCTGRAKALAKTFKKIAARRKG